MAMPRAVDLFSILMEIAERLYARRGWQYSGEIPAYALWPAGGACATRIFYKFLGI